GVLVHIPVAVLERVAADGFDWQVPGLRFELVTALIRALPKSVRRQFVPAPDHARAFVNERGPSDGPLLDVLAQWLSASAGVQVTAKDWDPEALPGYLRMGFSVFDGGGNELGMSKDLAELKGVLARRARREVASVFGDMERLGLTSFPEDGVEREVSAYW